MVVIDAPADSAIPAEHLLQRNYKRTQIAIAIFPCYGLEKARRDNAQSEGQGERVRRIGTFAALSAICCLLAQSAFAICCPAVLPGDSGHPEQLKDDCPAHTAETKRAAPSSHDVGDEEAPVQHFAADFEPCHETAGGWCADTTQQATAGSRVADVSDRQHPYRQHSAYSTDTPLDLLAQHFLLRENRRAIIPDSDRLAISHDTVPLFLLTRRLRL